MTDTQRRNQLLRRINKLSSDELKDLDAYVSKLEHSSAEKTKSGSYAGAWRDIDDAVFEDFTTQLIDKRRKNRNRIHDQGPH